MAYVVKRPGGRYELRESLMTDRGPRSRTLASFRELTADIVELALTRSVAPLSAGEIQRAARRAGAPVPSSPADAAAAALLFELNHGRQPTGRIARVLTAALAERGGASREPPSDAERAVGPWLSATLEQRGEALRDLLLLSDALPTSRHGHLRFPVVRTAA